MSTRRLVVVATLVFAAAFGGSRRADASSITYQFTSTVASVDTGGTGFPSSLSGVQVGDAISGSLTFDPATAAAASNPYDISPIYAGSTLYELPTAQFSVTIDGTLFNTWVGTMVAFVWNDTSAGFFDGIIFTNIVPVPAGGLYFGFGNRNYNNATTFTTDALPTTALPGPAGFTLGYLPSTEGPFLQSEPFSPSLAGTANTAVPEPATLLLVGGGLAAGIRRARRPRR